MVAICTPRLSILQMIGMIVERRAKEIDNKNTSLRRQKRSSIMRMLKQKWESKRVNAFQINFCQNWGSKTSTSTTRHSLGINMSLVRFDRCPNHSTGPWQSTRTHLSVWLRLTATQSCSMFLNSSGANSSTQSPKSKGISKSYFTSACQLFRPTRRLIWLAYSLAFTNIVSLWTKS